MSSRAPLRKSSHKIRVTTIVVLALLAGLSACSSSPDNTASTEDKITISPLCEEALAPLREYMKTHDEPITPPAKKLLRSMANDAYDGCSVDEFRSFADTELNPWAERVGLA